MAKIGPVFFCEKNFTDEQAAALRLQSVNVVAGLLPDDTAEALRVLDLAREHILGKVEWGASL